MGYRETLYNENQSLATEDMMQSPTMDQAMAKSASEPTIQTYAPGSPGKGGATASTVSLRSLDSRPVFTRPSETDVLGRPRLKPIRVRLAQRSRMKDGADAARAELDKITRQLDRRRAPRLRARGDAPRAQGALHVPPPELREAVRGHQRDLAR